MLNSETVARVAGEMPIYCAHPHLCASSDRLSCKLETCIVCICWSPPCNWEGWTITLDLVPGIRTTVNLSSKGTERIESYLGMGMSRGLSINTTKDKIVPETLLSDIERASINLRKAQPVQQGRLHKLSFLGLV